MENKFLKVGQTFNSKKDCFEYFKHLISKEHFDLISDNTEDMPLSRINNSLEIWINIINENSNNKFQDNKNIWIRNYKKECVLTKDSIFLEYQKLSFLFIKIDNKYTFLGLYQSVDLPDFDINWTAKFKKCNIDIFCLNQMKISNIINENMKNVINYFDDYQKESHDNHKIYKDKDTAISKIKEDCGEAYFISEDLGYDKEIADTYWESLKDVIVNEGFFEGLKGCSIIGIDEYGNNIIDEFFKIEKNRQTKERIEQYNRKHLYQNIRFCKVRNNINNNLKFPITLMDFDQEPFDKEITALVIFIGKKENELVRTIKKYYNETWYNGYGDEILSDVSFVDIYTNNCKTDNSKLITKNKNEIFDLLRIVTLVPFSLDDGLIRITELFKDLNNKSIKLFKMQGDIESIIQQLEKVPNNISEKIEFIQLFCNEKYDKFLRVQIFDRIFNILKHKQAIEYAEYSCNIENFEVIILTTGKF